MNLGQKNFLGTQAKITLWDLCYFHLASFCIYEMTKVAWQDCVTSQFRRYEIKLDGSNISLHSPMVHFQVKSLRVILAQSLFRQKFISDHFQQVLSKILFLLFFCRFVDKNATKFLCYVDLLKVTKLTCLHMSLSANPFLSLIFTFWLQKGDLTLITSLFPYIIGDNPNVR